MTYDYKFKEPTEAELKVRENEPTRIDLKEPYMGLIYDETEVNEDNSAAQEMLLNDYAATFCKDGE